MKPHVDELLTQSNKEIEMRSTLQSTVCARTQKRLLKDRADALRDLRRADQVHTFLQYDV